MNPLPLLCLLVAAGLAAAQDMPLHDILRPGETWQADSENNMPVSPDQRRFAQGILPLKEPTCSTPFLGGSTLLVADAADRYVWAFRVEKDGSLGPGDRYCRLRVRGDDRKKKDTPPEMYRADPSAICTDAANRTYVATSLGIQAFDPTGRLCGVFTAPPGRVTELRFAGDRLFARAGDKVYARRMLAEGPK